MAAATQLGALLLDALGEFERAVEAVPAPGRHRRIGRLNAPAWTVAHLASSVDGWVNVYAWGGEGDRWAGEWYERQAALSAGVALDTSLDDARAAFARIAERARASLGAADAARLRKDTVAPLGRWGLQPVAYLVARASAHLFAHAGELTVAASLVGAPDLGLPGRLAGVRDTPADETARYVARLAVDARHEIG
ncbi:MAG: DinB family protein, partial [Chloroflexi bacterium]|nr:DinB family protein [Chloroflexota bacterium]